MDKDLGKNISFDIFNADGTAFHELTLHKATYDSVVMSLGDKIVGDAYYKDSSLNVTCKEYIVYNGVNFELVNPPTIVREGMASDNSDLHGMTKYSFEFYHPMYKLSNMPFTDIAVRSDQERFLSQNKTFNWVGTMEDYVAKLNANLQETEWVVRLSNSLYIEGEPTAEITTLGDVLSFDNNSIADALKTGFDTYGISFVIDKLDATDADYASGKRFLVLFGLPSNEIIDKDTDGNPIVDDLNNPIPFVFKFGQGVGLKNNSRNPKNNKIVTRIAGYGSTNNIPYGYPQIRWWGDQSWTNTKNDDTDPLAYPIYEGIVGGEYVKLIKHPFTREHLMPSVYTESVFNKVSPYLERELPSGSIVPNPNYNPQAEIIDYYDAIASQEYPYKNEINPLSPSYEIHEFGDIKPELGAARIVGATPLNDELEVIDTWEYTMDENGEYHPSYFKIQLPILSFDIYACASITEEMHINMRGGACVGCTFPIQVDWDDYKQNFYDAEGNFAPYGAQRDYTKYPDSSGEKIEVIVQKEYSTFGTLMPNQYQYPKGETSTGANDGDLFVILGISLPLSYITNAEERLDVAMKAYMLENNEHYFDYPLKFDEYFLRTHLYILEQIRPNTIVRFEYNDEELQLFVKQLTIKFGNAPLPQYDITLTDDIDVVLNQIGQVVENVGKISSIVSLLRQNFSEAGLSIGQVRTLIDTYGSQKFISRVRDDVANGVVTFLNGLWVKAKNLFGIDQNGNASLNDVDAIGTVRVGENPTDSLLDGSGTIIDDGRVQTTDMEVRGTLKVLDLVASQIHSLDGYYYFSDTMKIARVVDTTPEGQATRTARVYFEKQYDNDFLKFYTGDFLLSVSANLDDTSTERETSQGGNTIRDIATQSWMSVTNTSAGMGDELWADVQILAPNNMPQAGAYVARRGNVDEASNRTSSWCISVEEGRITYYVNQTSKDINDENYGLVIGKLPDIAPVRNVGAVGEVGVYAKYLLAQHLLSVRYAGDVVYTTIDAGEWDAVTAQGQTESAKEYYFNEYTEYGIRYITRTKVTHNEAEWICIGNDLGSHFTSSEPNLANSSKWAILSGGSRITETEIKYATTATDSIDDDIDGEGLSLGGNDVTWYADQSQCEYNALFPYMWKKTVTKTVANPTGTSYVELIGVYGETGLNAHVTTDKDNIFIPVDANGKPIEELTEEIPIHLWLEETEIQIGGWTEEGTSVPATEVLNASELYNEGVEANTFVVGNEYTLEINISDTAILTPDSPKTVELRVRGTQTIGGKEYHYSRLHTVNIYGSLQGKDGDSPLVVELSRDQIFIPTAEGQITTGGSVVLNFASYQGSRQLIDDEKATISPPIDINYQGTHNGYLSVTHSNQMQQITVSYTQGAAMTDDDWAMIDINLGFPNGTAITKSIMVYPNSRGMDAVGVDALNVKMQPEEIQFPVYDNVSVAMSNIFADIVATQGSSSVAATISSVSVKCFRGSTEITVANDKFLTATKHSDTIIAVGVVGGKSVNKTTDYGEISIQYSVLGLTKTMKIYARPYLIEQPVSYTVNTTEIVVGNNGGEATIKPNLLPLTFTRMVGKAVQTLDTLAKVNEFFTTQGITIYDTNGNVLATPSYNPNGIGLTSYAATIGSVAIHFVSVEGINVDEIIYVKRDGAPGRPLQTRLWTNVLTPEFTYRNDSLATEATSSDGVLYMDYIVVEDTGFTSGYDVWIVPSDTNHITIASDQTPLDLAALTAEARKTYMEGLLFEQTSINVSSAWFTTLMAKNANIRMLSGAVITMTDGQNNVVAGMGNGRTIGGESKPYHFWSGGATGDAANFSVDTQGNLKAIGADLQSANVNGQVKANMFFSPIIDISNDYNIGVQYGLNNFGRTYYINHITYESERTITLPPVEQYAGLELQFIDSVMRWQIGVTNYIIKTPEKEDNRDYISLLNNTNSFKMPFGKMVILKARVTYAGAGCWDVVSGLDTHAAFHSLGNVSRAAVIDFGNVTTAKDVDIYKGTECIVMNVPNVLNNDTTPILYLPRAKEVRRIFGLGSNEPFSYRLRIVMGYQNPGLVDVRFPIDTQSTSECKYFLDYNGNTIYDNSWANNKRLRLAQCDVLELMHVDDGTYEYAQILNIHT